MSEGDAAFTTQTEVLAALEPEPLRCDAPTCVAPATYWLRFRHWPDCSVCFVKFGCDEHTAEQIKIFQQLRRWSPALCTTHDRATTLGGGRL